jgi:hypothetical protein
MPFSGYRQENIRIFILWLISAHLPNTIKPFILMNKSIILRRSQRLAIVMQGCSWQVVPGIGWECVSHKATHRDETAAPFFFFLTISAFLDFNLRIGPQPPHRDAEAH